MSNNLTSVYNSTQETIKICLLDTKNNEINTILTADEIWTRYTDSGRNTIVIIPLNDNQETFSYTLSSSKGVIIKRHKTLGKLMLVPARRDNRKLEADNTITGHRCILPSQPYQPSTRCVTTECIVFNESNEPIRVCITDFSDRNTHIILAHGEHARVDIPSRRNAIMKLYLDNSSLVKVSVVDFNLNKAEPNFITRAKDSIDSDLHFPSCDAYKFMRVFKKDGYFTTETDVIYLQRSGNIPFSYQFTKECCQKVRSFDGRHFEIKEVSANKYDVSPKTPEDICCIL